MERGVPVPVWGEPKEDGAGRSHLGWHTGCSMLLLTVSVWVPGLPVGDMFPYPHPPAFVGFFMALTMVTILLIFFKIYFY